MIDIFFLNHSNFKALGMELLLLWGGKIMGNTENELHFFDILFGEKFSGGNENLLTSLFLGHFLSR